MILDNRVVCSAAKAAALRVEEMLSLLLEDSFRLLKVCIMLPAQDRAVQGQGCSLDHPGWWVTADGHLWLHQSL